MSGNKIISPDNPKVFRDFRLGRITHQSIANFLSPENSVGDCLNIYFDTIVGYGCVRPGTTLLGSAVAATRSPLGLAEFVGKNGTPNYLMSVFKGASNATLYYWNGSAWTATNKTSLSNTARNRFATLGGSVFVTNTVDGMSSSPSGTTFSATNSIAGTATLPLLGVKPGLIYRYNARMLCSGDTNNPSRVYFSSIVDPSLSSADIAVTSITSASTTATVTTSSSHGLVTGATVRISGATQTEYNGFYVITVTGASTFTYTFAGSGTSPATGTITASATFITWNTDESTGDWIDINPDDGGQITGFSESSTFVLVFKGNGFYRLDTINRTADAQNIYNVGAVSQEGIVLCQGVTYFFSGTDIRQTSGGFPEQISRAGVQDVINAIPQANWADVFGATDGLNVYFFVGNVTLNTSQNTQKTITNCAIKYSPRDQAWTVLAHADRFQFSALFTDTNGRMLRSADTDGAVQTVNLGVTDNSTPIYYELETQEIEFGSRAHLKQIANMMVIYNKFGGATSLKAICDGNEAEVKGDLSRDVNYATGIQIPQFHFVSFKWYGETNGTPPIFEGLEFTDVNDLGLTHE